jgi:DNA-binding transcriptional ArsR family regulator
MKANKLTPEALELVAARFRVLGEPNRLRLIAALEQGEKNVSELVAETELTQANVSRHLQTLTEAGLLGRRKEGLNRLLLHRRRVAVQALRPRVQPPAKGAGGEGGGLEGMSHPSPGNGGV